ncbi:MAG: hydroxymethylglutaryl-CoA lyase [Thermoleophilia bacterium]|nr:hydroxymethylglutaryl-CoA lyase [Thermoleophilia bacterium]
MTRMPDRVTIVEVGPRDGLQNESSLVPTATKVQLVERLAATGLRHIEATSFVNPKAVPQLADAAEVMATIDRVDGVTYPVLVPNERGYEGALTAGATSISVFTAASESFTRRNVNATIAESIDRFRPIVDRAASDGIHVRGYVSTAWGCPFEGPIAPAAVHRVVEQLADLGIADVSIGDTIGVAVPGEIEPVMGPLLEFEADLRLALHLHDTRGMAMANTWAGLQLGIDTFDASVAGLGGCPFAPGATGNLATEDLVWMLHRHGIDTGIDLEALVEVARWISSELDRPVGGHVTGPRIWPWQGQPIAD